MKKLSLLLLSMLFINMAFAADFETEKKQLEKALKDAGYATQFDSKDNSINFRYKDVLHWFTWESTDGQVIYLQLNKKGFKLTGDGAFDKDLAIIAVNEVNRQYKAVKMYIEKERIVQCQQIILKSPADLNRPMLEGYLRAFDNADNTFKTAYKKLADDKAKVAADKAKAEEEAAKAKAKADSVVYVEKEAVSPVIMQGNIEIANVDAHGKTITDYGQTINSESARYLQVKLKAYTEVAGKYTLNARVTTPDKHYMLPENGAKYSYSTEVTFKKAKKVQEILLKPFGKQTGSVWTTKGEYILELWDGDIYLGKQTFVVR